MKSLATIAVLLFASVTLSACSHTPVSAPVPAVEETTETQESTSQPAESVSAGEETGVAPENDKIAVVASNFAFDVTEIKAKVGDPLTVAVTNEEGFHDFVIDELEVDSGMIPAGETKELTIPTNKPGTYEFYCSVGEHRKMGMKGMLIIE